MKRLSEFVEQGGGRGFDAIRMLAASGVLVSHAFSLTIEDGREHEPLVLLTGRWSIGAVCVALFFVISGFLIAQSADRNRSLLRFAEKRALRIFPALAVNVFLTALLLGPAVSALPMHDYFSSPAAFGYLKLALALPGMALLPGVFLNNPDSGAVNGSLWTLRSEFACYVMTAVLVYVLRIRSSLVYLILVIAALVLEAVRAYSVSSHVHLFGLFVAGSFLYWARAHVPVSRTWVLAGGLLFLSSLCWPMLSPFGSLGLAYATVASGYLASGFQVLHHRDYSYGLYLWAFPVQQTLIQLHSMPWWLNASAAFPIALGLAMLSWHFVEKPAKAIKLQLFK